MAAETNAEAFDRGAEVGRVAAVLDQHGDHLAKINGSMERVATELRRMNDNDHGRTLAIQRLADAFEAAQQTELAKAKALREADDARRSALVRAVSVVALLLTAVGLWIAYGR